MLPQQFSTGTFLLQVAHKNELSWLIFDPHLMFPAVILVVNLEIRPIIFEYKTHTGICNSCIFCNTYKNENIR